MMSEVPFRFCSPVQIGRYSREVKVLATREALS